MGDIVHGAISRVGNWPNVQAWRDFAGWRVNYDAALMALAKLTMAPPAPWSSPEMREQRRSPCYGRGS